jgi:deazaflavin-dependent oxidoreductase (nitroreductase family)
MMSLPPQVDLTLPFGYLETIGRKTGLPREIEIWFTGEPRRIYLRSGGGTGKDWIRNAQRQPRVRIRIGDVWLSGTFRLVEGDPELDDRIRQLFAAKYPQSSFSATPEERDHWLATSIPVVIDLDRS